MAFLSNRHAMREFFEQSIIWKDIENFANACYLIKCGQILDPSLTDVQAHYARGEAAGLQDFFGGLKEDILQMYEDESNEQEEMEESDEPS